MIKEERHISNIEMGLALFAGGLLVIGIGAVMIAFPYIPVGILGILSIMFLNRSRPTM